MANTASAEKRNRQAQKRRARNVAVRTGVKGAVKKVREALDKGDARGREGGAPGRREGDRPRRLEGRAAQERRVAPDLAPRPRRREDRGARREEVAAARTTARARAAARGRPRPRRGAARAPAAPRSRADPRPPRKSASRRTVRSTGVACPAESRARTSTPMRQVAPAVAVSTGSVARTSPSSTAGAPSPASAPRRASSPRSAAVSDRAELRLGGAVLERPDVDALHAARGDVALAEPVAAAGDRARAAAQGEPELRCGSGVGALSPPRSS